MASILFYLLTTATILTLTVHALLFLGRQLFAFTRQQPRMLNRFYSIETPVDTAVQTPASQFPDQPEFDLEPEAAVERRIPNEANLSPHDAWKQRQRQSKWPGH